jgi:glutathione synthase
MHMRPDDRDWYRETGREWKSLTAFDAVIMRKDPPFDFEFMTATWLLERAEAAGVRVFNKPRALRDHSEKIAISEFDQFTPTTLVARDMQQLQQFIDEQRDVILKPLDGMGGSQIFRIHRNDPNRNVILETLTHEGTRTVMAQRYLPEISAGDKRILLIAGQPVPYCLARIPKAGETRGNLAVGGTGVAQDLSARDREIAETLGPILIKRGLMLASMSLVTISPKSTSPAQPAWSKFASKPALMRPVYSSPLLNTHAALPDSHLCAAPCSVQPNATSGTTSLRLRHAR